MASNQTPNYALNQWAPSDQVIRLDFNADNEKIDTALAGLSQQLSAKADQSEVNTLSATLQTKANLSALNSLTTTVNSKASKTELNTLRQNMTDGDLWVRLQSASLSSAAASLSVDLSNVNLLDYWQIKVYFSCANCPGVCIRVNKESSGIYIINPIPSGTSNNSATSLTTFYPPNNGTYPIAGSIASQILAVGGTAVFYCCNSSTNGGSTTPTVAHLGTVTWDTLTSLDFVATSGNLPAGASAVVIGMPR